MTYAEWARVPIGRGAERWTTRKNTRTVLVVVHSVTAAQRLLDILPLFETDIRVQVIFTTAPGVFTRGIDNLIEDLNGVSIPWAQAIHLKFDLAIASDYTDLHDIQAPIVVLPHGSGYNKFTPYWAIDKVPTEKPIYGLSPQNLMRDGRVVPSTVILSHTDDLYALKESCPEALPAALIAGDPTYDRIQAGRNKRLEFRDSLAVPPETKLLLISSTWGHYSLFGSSFELFEKAFTDLPLDKYLIAAVLHPAIWYGHGTRQIRSWLKRYLDQGLLLADPNQGWPALLEDWRPMLVSADFVIGDHGSVTLYAISAGVPVVRIKVPRAAIVPGSAMEILHMATPEFDLAVPLAEQLESAVSGCTEESYGLIRARMNSAGGESAAILRRSIYQHLGLTEPQHPAEFPPIPLPSCRF